MKQFSQIFILFVGVVLMVVFGLGLFDSNNAPDPAATEEWEEYQEARDTAWMFITPITFLPWVIIVLLAIFTLYFLYGKTKRWM